jgi:tetratricopeptide (TPR) repeat protein
LYNGNIKEAIVTYERLIEEAGPIPDLVHRKIELLLDQGQKQQVIEELKELIRLYPDMPEYTGMLLDMYQSNGQRDEAKKLIEELLIKDPQNPHLLLAMADYHNQLGEREQTYAYLKKAFSSDLLEIDSKVKLLIEIHDNQTPIDQEAFELLEILKEKHGADAKTYAIQGDFYLKNNKREEAFEAFKKALEIDKSKYPIWHESLFLAYYLGKHEELYQHAKNALDFFPTIANVYLYAGVGALYTNRFEEAIEYFAIGKDFVVKDNFLTAEFNFQLGEANMAVKNYDAAQQYYKEALKTDPSNAVYLNNYAYRLAVHQVYLNDALLAIEKADRITPNEGNFLDTYAWVLFQRKEFEQALDKIKRAFELSPNSAVVAEHYGDILFKLGQETKAIELWLTSRDLGNSDDILQKKIETKSYHERKP